MKRNWQKIKKFSRLSLDALGPNALLGRFKGQKVLMNSLPKSGTNLLERVVQQIPYMHRRISHTLDGWNVGNKFVLHKIRTIQNGQFMTAHLPAHQNILNLVQQIHIKTLFMIRDPRDIVISHFNYVTSIDRSHPSHSYFKDMTDDDARLMSVIKGVDGVVQPIWKVLDAYQPWLTFKGVLVVRFEDLIGTRGGGNDQIQMQTVQAICQHLEIIVNEKQLKKICSGIYSEKALTFRKAQIGNWRKVFSQEHIDAFMLDASGYLEKYGYTQ